VTAPTKYVTSTTADGATTVGGNVYLKASANGQYVTTLGGSSAPIVTSATNVPGKIDLTKANWKLDVEDWQPAQPYGTVGVAGSETKKPVVSVALDELKSWSDIPELQYASGVGTYTTTVNLPKDWRASTHGATIDLGQVTDSFRLAVNGQDVPIDQVSGQADLGTTLHAGVNTLVVRVATTLNNRLYDLDTAVKNRGLLQEYGLVGPVTLTPYRLVQVNPAKPGTPALRATARPHLVGKAKVGRTLHVQPGAWTPAATSYVFTWKRNGKVIKTAHAAHYKVKRTDRGKRITVTVTASRPGYTSASATSQVKKIHK
jgi:opacity protein-like surface antigen